MPRSEADHVVAALRSAGKMHEYSVYKGEVHGLRTRENMIDAVTAVCPSFCSSFTASIELSSCGGGKKLSDSFSWSAQDTAIARVDALTGRVTGRSPGSTVVEARGTRYGQVGFIPVIVR